MCHYHNGATLWQTFNGYAGSDWFIIMSARRSMITLATTKPYNRSPCNYC